MDKRKDIRKIYKDKKARKRLMDALVAMKKNIRDPANPTTKSKPDANGGMYQQYVNWHGDSSLSKVAEVFVYTATSDDLNLTKDVFKSITFEATYKDRHGVSKTEEFEFSSKKKLRIKKGTTKKITDYLNSLVSHDIEWAGNTFAKFKVEFDGTGKKLVVSCSNCPYVLKNFKCTVNEVEKTFTFSKGAKIADFNLRRMQIAHSSPVFLPWHRVFIRMFELDLQFADKVINGEDGKIALPYWDWTRDRSLDPKDKKQGYLWQPDFLGGTDHTDAAKSQFLSVPSGWEVFRTNGTKEGPLRRFLNGGGLPSLRNVKYAQKRKTYDSVDFNRGSKSSKSYRNTLEGWVSIGRTSAPTLHNKVHVSVGGEDGVNSGHLQLSVSPNDPIFFFHHCNIDRLWAIWQRKNRKQKYPKFGPLPGRRIIDPMIPWDGSAGASWLGANRNILAMDVWNCAKLSTNVKSFLGSGYTYDSFSLSKKAP